MTTTTTTTTTITKTQTLRIILISDIHNIGRRIDQVSKWIVDCNEQTAVRSDFTTPTEWIDAVFCMGDIGNLAPGCQDPYLTSAEIGMCSSNFVLMSNIAPKIVFVPGNHDPVQLFSNRADDDPLFLSPTSINAHRRWVRIVPGVVVCGIGGSGPAKIGPDEDPFFSFPHKSEQDFEEQVASLEFSAPYEPSAQPTEYEDIPPEFATVPFFESKIPGEISIGYVPVTDVGPEDSVILMTHEGPAGSSTTVDFDHNGTGVTLSCGSEAIAKLIRDNQGTGEGVRRHIVAAVHGHSHNSAGMSSIGDVKVINPGALCDGNFALLTLAKNPSDGLWHVSDCTLVHLPDLPPLIQIRSLMALNN